MSEADRSQARTSLVGTSLGRYRLERWLGEGGMGVVYAAKHESLGKPVAVKVLNERYDASEAVRLRFLREGQAASRIRHPNIVDVYDVGTESSRAYLVMELLEGEDLRSLIEREAPLSIQRTADLLLPVVSALAAAHDLGVIHRDLKPDNIFLSAMRNTVTPKVLDFGISKVIDQEKPAALTGTGALLGTPYYMSPEQAQGARDIDRQSDQYSVGVILYECVTGRRPVEEPSIYQLIHRIVHGDFAPPRQLNPNLTAPFEQLVLTAMARQPKNRFPDMRAFGRVLLDFASERVRANHTDEFTVGDTLLSPAGTPLKNVAFQLGTTLGESTHERDNSRRPASTRTTWPLVGLLVFLLGFITAMVRTFSRSARPERPHSAGPALAVSTASPPPPAMNPSSPVPEESSRETPVSSPPAPSASASEENVGKAPIQPIKTPNSTKPSANTRPAKSTLRPELAPR